MASRFGFPALQIRREAKDAKGFDKMAIHLDGDKLSICGLTTATAKKVPGKSKYAIFPYIQDLDTREGWSKNYTITCEINHNDKLDSVLLRYGPDCFNETARLRDMAAKEASKNSPKGESKATAQQKSRGTRQLKKEVVDSSRR